MLTDLYILDAPMTELDLTSSLNSLKILDIQRTLIELFGQQVFPNVVTVQLLDNAGITLFNSSTFPSMTSLMISKFSFM